MKINTRHFLRPRFCEKLKREEKELEYNGNISDVVVMETTVIQTGDASYRYFLIDTQESFPYTSPVKSNFLSIT